MEKFSKKRNRAFTLVETLVAISIFTMSLLSIMVVLGQGIADTNYAKNKIIAAYLAQEGIEYLRNMRDTYVLYSSGNSGWPQFLNKLTNPTARCNQNSGCYFGDLSVGDFTNPSQPMIGLSITSCSSTCPVLLYNSTIGKYNYLSGANSGFVRKMQTTQISADEVKIFSTIYWPSGSGTHAITFSENLFNWIE